MSEARVPARNQNQTESQSQPTRLLVESFREDDVLRNAFYDWSSQLSSSKEDPDKTLTAEHSQATNFPKQTKATSSRTLGGEGQDSSTSEIASSSQAPFFPMPRTSQAETTGGATRQMPRTSVGAVSKGVSLDAISRETSFGDLSGEGTIAPLSQYDDRLEDLTKEMQEYATDPEDATDDITMEGDITNPPLPLSCHQSKPRDEDMDLDPEQGTAYRKDVTDMDLDDDPEPCLGESPAYPITVDSDNELFTPTRSKLKVLSPRIRRSGRSPVRTPGEKGKGRIFPPPSFNTKSPVPTSAPKSVTPASMKSPKLRPASAVKPTSNSISTAPLKVDPTAPSTSRSTHAGPSHGAQTQLPYKVQSPSKSTDGKAAYQTSLAKPKPKHAPALAKASSFSKVKPPSHTIHSNLSTAVLGPRPRSPSNTAEPGPSTKKPRLMLPESSVSEAQNRLIPDPDDPSNTSAAPVSVEREDIHVVVTFPLGRLWFDDADLGTLASGVRWEVAMPMSKGQIEQSDITSARVAQLEGSNVQAAPRVRKVFRTTDPSNKSRENDKAAPATVIFDERGVKDPWRELDEEDAHLSAWPFAGLGLQKPELSDSNSFDFFPGTVPIQQYHGHVHFRAKLIFKQSKFKLELKPAELGTSSNYARRFGSENFIRVKIADKEWKNSSLGPRMKEFFKTPFYIGGYVYRSFRASDQNVILLRTNERWEGLESMNGTGKDEGLDFLGMMGLVNPMELNAGQSMKKWSSRFALGQSSSVPVYQIPPRNMEIVRDTVSEQGSVMTDGSGEISLQVQREIHRSLDLQRHPSSFQFRAFGGKGLALGQHCETDSEPRLRLRDSQIKVVLHRPFDPSQTIIDLLQTSHTKSPAQLGYEVIINLHANRVSTEAFQELMKVAIRKRLQPLMMWTESELVDEKKGLHEKKNLLDEKKAMVALCVAVYKAGGVGFNKRRRLLVTTARARGYGDADDGEDDDDDEDTEGENTDSGDTRRSTAWWPDPVSGCPSSLHETAVFMLTSGFRPASCPFLLGKLEKVLQNEAKASLRGCRFEMEMSATAFIAPNVTGLLKEGEVFFKSSEANLMRPDGVKCDQIWGIDVLITRSPCKLPTDVRKMKLVDIPQLRMHTNTVLLSTQGNRRAADYLSGGNYDGDKVLRIWDPALVTPFKNADLKWADEPQAATDAFEQSSETVSEFLEKTKNIPREDKIRLIQDHTLSEILTANKIGIYNQYWLNAVYTLGYDRPETVQLAYIFCIGLDGVRNGKTIKKEVLATHGKKWGGKELAWLAWLKDKDFDYSKLPAKRPSTLKPFIIDKLMPKVIEQKESELTKLGKVIEKVMKTAKASRDEHLDCPWKEARERATGSTDLYNDMERIRVHVESRYGDYKDKLQDMINKTPSKHQSSKKQSSKNQVPTEKRQDVLRKQSRLFEDQPSPGDYVVLSAKEARSYKASYAYIHAPYSKFCWEMAMRSLCEIKADALGPTKTVTSDFYETMEPKVFWRD